MTPSHPTGTVAVLAHEPACYLGFAVALAALAKGGLPNGKADRLRWAIGVSSPAEGRNQLVREHLADPDRDWIWFMDSDHSFDSTCLLRLLERDRYAVAPLCLTKYPPFEPVAWTAAGRLDPRDHPDGGEVAVESCGAAGLLVRREALEAVDDPWFEVGQVDPERLCEDVLLCRKIRDAGFDVHVDLDVPLGHIAPATWFPRRGGDGAWEAAAMLGRGATVGFPHGHFVAAGEEVPR